LYAVVHEVVVSPDATVVTTPLIVAWTVYVIGNELAEADVAVVGADHVNVCEVGTAALLNTTKFVGAVGA